MPERSKPAAASLIASKEEWIRTALAASTFFLILCSYTMLRPVRDEMAVRYGADRLHWLFTGTFLCTLLVVPVFGWLVRRVSRARILTIAYGFLILNLGGFCAMFWHGGNASSAAAFFVWISVVNLFMVSLFWSNVSDAFTTNEAHRLYGYIAAGGTLGALAGPAFTALAAKQLSIAALLAGSALLLAAATVCMVTLRRHGTGKANDTARPIGGSIVAGVSLTLHSAQLRGIALLVICLTAVSTVLYVGMIDTVGKTLQDSGERRAFFASIDLTVNIVALAFQLLGTARIVQRWGLMVMLIVSPLCLLAGFGVISIWSAAWSFAAVQVLHRAGEYALNKPGREMIYTTVGPESRFKAKNFIDTAVYRANDAVSAWLINLVRAAGLSPVLLVGVPAALLWLLAGFRIGREHDLEKKPDGEKPHEPA